MIKSSTIVAPKCQPDHSCCLIAGIGAADGGIQALQQLFQSLPVETGIGFVVIQKLVPADGRSLAELLSMVTVLPVCEAQDNTVVEPDHIYIAANEITITKGRLTVTTEQELPDSAIDSFFASLAAEQKRNAIGIILSGVGTDGSQGMKQIKAAGGLMIVQDPQSAAFSSMPHNALVTNQPDYVLPPAGIACLLAQLSRSCVANTLKNPEDVVLQDPEDYDRIIKLLSTIKGVNFQEYKQLMVKRRILRRMELLNITNAKDYIAYLKHNHEEIAALKQDILINVTNFFRDPESFVTLEKTIFPFIIANSAANEPIRIWVPGCSTGEEAYSLAIVLLEFFENRGISKPVQIFATDINETVIAKARTGIYPKSIAVDVSPARLNRFFIESDQGYQVHKSIRDLCVFAKQDISSDPPISRVNLISCRNVMIYFGPALQKKMFPIFHYALTPGGFLMLGASESIGMYADLFDLIEKKSRIYAKKAVSVSLFTDFSSVNYNSAPLSHHSQEELSSRTDVSWLVIQKEADQIVLAKYAPVGVIINRKLEIVQFRGRTGAYLEPPAGIPSTNLLRMAREGLAFGLRSAVYQAIKENIPVHKEGLFFFHNEQVRDISIDVIPIEGSVQVGQYFLVLFTENNIYQRADNKTDAFCPACNDRNTLDYGDDNLRLKQEVAATQEYLQSIIGQYEATTEDYRYASEELQTSNEELQTMNEELETAREELQSANEELITINEELKTRNEELIRKNQELDNANEDLNNMLQGLTFPILVLNSSLAVRRFNGAAEKLFNLISTDVGRPISNINANIEIQDLEKKSEMVIETLNSFQKDIRDRWGHWYSLQIRPYKTRDLKIDGVIITLADIHDSKQSKG